MPVAILDSQGKGVDVMGVSVIHQMPLAVAERFSDLIRTVEDIVEQATLPVLERLRTWLKGRDAAAIDSRELPEIIDASTPISRLPIGENEPLSSRPIGASWRRTAGRGTSPARSLV